MRDKNISFLVINTVLMGEIKVAKIETRMHGYPLKNCSEALF